MSVEEMRSRIAQRVRQAIAESNIALSSAQRGQLDGLVGDITDSVLLEFDAMLGQVAPAAAQPARFAPQAPAPAADAGESGPGTRAAAAGDEEVLWEGRPFLSLGERYVITSERVRIITGVLAQDQEDIELVRVQDVDHTQGISERIFNIGDVLLRTADSTAPRMVLRNVTDPQQVHEILRRAVLNARRKYPFIYEQKM
jgi:hypothetical protein